ncbi:MAG: hypothetical protein H0U04_11065 [Rubrobacter sp.]|nr:hypothetical protein [Rubrobacter sp.]
MDHRQGHRGFPVVRNPAALAILVGFLGLLVGVLTAYGQEWLPEEMNSLANSSGSWSLMAFLLALLAASPRTAAACGALALAALLGGYVLGAEVRGYPPSSALITFWGLAAVLVGPFLGLGARWVRSGPAPLTALGVGGVSGVLIGEGAYGLLFIADTTYPPYWWGEIFAGVVLLCWVATWRLRRLVPVALSAVVSIAIAAAFVGVYSGDLIAFFS